MPDMVPNMQWFAELRMPPWTPPGWLFPVAWLLVSKPTQVARSLAHNIYMRDVPILPYGPSGLTITDAQAVPMWSQVAATMRLTACGSVAWGPISLWAVHLALGDAWNEVHRTELNSETD